MIKVTTARQRDGRVKRNEVASTLEEVIDTLQAQGFEYNHWTGFWAKDDYIVFIEEVE